MQQGTTPSHPHPIDKNASILWARDLLNRTDSWLIVLAEAGAKPGTIQSLIVMTAAGKPVVDTTNPDPTEMFSRLSRLLDSKEVVVWDLSAHHKLLEQTALVNSLPLLNFRGHCAMRHYARYQGEVNEAKSDYKSQALPITRPNASAAQKAKAVLDSLYTMAGTNQHTDAADTGDTHWSAAFYKQKAAGPGDFLRNLFKK